MAKKPEENGVKVVLLCVYSGHADDPGPGSVLTLGADEAARLIGLGAAKPYEPEAEAG